MMKKLYTATGILKQKRGSGGRTYPYVSLGNQEYVLNMQEMVLWTILNWRILSEDEIKALYDKKTKELGIDYHRSVEACQYYLVQRGLIAEGCGETGADALYDLISSLYVVPISENIFLRFFSFIKLTFIKGVPFSVTRKILFSDKRSEGEKKVMRLAKQARFSTAEIIKCVEKNKINFANDEEILDTIYDDEDTTSDNIAYAVRSLSACRPVLADVANLYLRQNIVFERA